MWEGNETDIRVNFIYYLFIVGSVVGMGDSVVSTQESNRMVTSNCYILSYTGLWILSFVCIVSPMKMGGITYFSYNEKCDVVNGGY